MLLTLILFESFLDMMFVQGDNLQFSAYIIANRLYLDVLASVTDVRQEFGFGKSEAFEKRLVEVSLYFQRLSCATFPVYISFPYSRFATR
jgi:hypothetical protein